MSLTKVPPPLLDSPQLALAANRIINGKFAIDQRNEGAVKLFNTYGTQFGPDRWIPLAYTGAGTFNGQRDADTSYPGEYRLKIEVVNPDAVMDSGKAYSLQQGIEGYNMADLYAGSANAQQITLAFEVESTITGTFPVAFLSSNYGRSYVTTYTINAANTRETKTITLTLDTSGTWTTVNGRAMSIYFGLAYGTSSHAPSANVWATGLYLGLAGLTNFMATAGNIIRFKNVRLYKGAVDLGVDQRLYAEELRLCQRYYRKVSLSGYAFPGNAQTTSVGIITIRWEPMRAVPTLTLPTTGSGAAQATPVNSGGNIPSVIGTVVASSVGVDGAYLTCTGFTGAWASGDAFNWWGNAAEFTLSAEL
jgi:hypothetical protein